MWILWLNCLCYTELDPSGESEKYASIELTTNKPEEKQPDQSILRISSIFQNSHNYFQNKYMLTTYNYTKNNI
jgi:hypothetical protein